MSDISVNPVNLIPKPTANNRLSYLITIEDTISKTKGIKRFVTVDRPDLEVAFVKAKGVYVTNEEEDVINNYQDILTAANKEDIIEVMIPWGKINNVRSLIFRAK